MNDKTVPGCLHGMQEFQDEPLGLCQGQEVALAQPVRVSSPPAFRFSFLSPPRRHGKDCDSSQTTL